MTRSVAVTALLILLAATAVSASPAAAAGVRASAPEVVVVSTHGSDRSSGTVAHPLRTIRTALDRLGPAGGAVELRGGVYRERVHLHGEHGVTLQPYAGEHAVLDGRGLRAPQGLTAMIEIDDSSAITVHDLDITGYRTTYRGVVPAGIYVHGHDDGVSIVGNHVHDLGNDNPTLGSFDINAHGIAVYGDDPNGPVSNLVIRANTVDRLRLGASETVVVNGNVAHWAIIGNHIHDVNNIGIDAIGFEPTLTGRYRYTNINRARDGVIAGNDVTRVRSKGNPAYWQGNGWCDCADGIYVDGGTHIVIRDNHVVSSDIGIEVAAENARGSADHVLVRANLITASLFTGLTTGGYCNGARACGGVQTGTSHDNVFEDNRLRGNNQLDDGSPELLVQYHAYRDVFRDNDITATDSAHVVYGTVPHSDSGRIAPNRSDGNIFSANGVGPSQMRFGWDGRTWVGGRAYVAATGQDEHSRFLTPR